MPYSLDLRERVVSYVRSGDSIDEAVKLFKVSRATIYRWLNRADLRATVVTRRRRKLDDQALMQHVREYPATQLKDRAAHFNVHPTAIFYAFKRLNITRKKTATLFPTRPSSATTISESIAHHRSHPWQPRCGLCG